MQHLEVSCAVRLIYKSLGAKGLRKKEALEVERGRTRSPSMENSLWKRLWTCRKTDFKIMMMMMMMMMS